MTIELEEEIGEEIVPRYGRGVRSIRASPSEADPADVQAAKRRHLLELLASLLARGLITPEEIAGALRKSHDPGGVPAPEAARSRIEDLQTELRSEQAANAFLDGEVARFESALAGQRELVKEGLCRIAALERQLEETRETTAKLVTASRDSLRTLQRVGTDLTGNGSEPTVLAPLAQDLCDLAKAALELHSATRARDVPPTADLDNG